MNLTQFAVRKLTEVENLMTAVERVIDYTKLDSEPGYDVKRLPPEKWPDKGSINFQDISLAYYPGGPQVLRNISLSIKAGAKIGVVGRKGSGKSSFVAALMRMPEAEGDILIDDVVLGSINLRGSRQAITVLGQNPVLFSGSVRKKSRHSGTVSRRWSLASFRTSPNEKSCREFRGAVGLRITGARCKFKCRRKAAYLLGSCSLAE